MSTDEHPVHSAVHPIRVVMLDDEVAIGRMLESWGEASSGFSVRHFTDPADLFRVVRQGDLDVLISDIKMPQISGYEVIERARAAAPDLPIIALTAEKEDPSVEIRCIESGANYFLGKPFSFNKLSAVVLALDERAREARAQRETLQSITESRDFLQSILENTNDVVLVKDLQGRIVLANRKMHEMFGLDPRGLRSRDLVPPEVSESLERVDAEVVRSEKTMDHEFRFEHEGREYTFSQNVFPLRDKQGNVSGVCCIARDITARTEMEEELRLLSLFPESSPNIVLRLDPAGTITYANPEAEHWLAERGLPPIGLYHLLPEDYTARLHQVMRIGETATEEIEHEGRWYSFKMNPFPDHDACMVTLSDITELKRISLEREMYFQAFRDAVHGVVITDPEGNILHVNRAFTELYGYEPEEAVGRNPRILNPGRQAYYELGYSDLDYDALFAKLWQDIKDPAVGRWEGEIVNRRRDGKLVWVYLFISAIRSADGRVVGYVGMPMDITRRREQEMAIRVECYRALSELAETRDNETGEHLNRLAYYSARMAEYMDQPQHFVDKIRLFAPLHDIGKVGIPDAILLAPRKLDPAEWATMQSHAEIGWRILADRPTLEMAADIARYHHEHWDGNGYPHSLAGEEIPLCARIVAIADVYDALRSSRPYKEPWSHEGAAAIIREGAGTHFDPALVEAFEALGAEFQEIFNQFPSEE